MNAKLSTPASLLAAGASLALVSAPLAAGDGCAKPGMEIVGATLPHGPVVAGDGQTDKMETFFNEPQTYRFSLGGLSHEDSKAVAGNYAKFLAVSHTVLPQPIPLGACAELQVHPGWGAILPIPNSLEMQATVNMTGLVPMPSVEAYFQQATFDLGTLELATSDLQHVRYDQGPWQGDPTTDKDYSCYYWGTYGWSEGDEVGTVWGRVYWPDDCDGNTDPAPGTHPLVVLMHDESTSYTDYHYLLRHLAFNGFIVASIDVSGGVDAETRAKRLRTYIKFLRSNWTYKSSVQNSIALIGHGTGAEAALVGARLLRIDWNTSHDIDAVVAVAPTDDELVELSGADAENLLVIAGSRDEVVRGYCPDGNAPGCGGIPSDVQRTGFAIYDRAGTEGDTEYGGAPAWLVNKSMVFVEHADHLRWAEGCTDPNQFALYKPLDCQQHHDALAAYSNAFLKMHLKGESSLEPYFTGDWTPKALADADVHVTHQHSQATGRRVIDMVGFGGWEFATLGTVSKSFNVTVAKKGTLWDWPGYTSPHDTKGLVLQWKKTLGFVTPYIRWTLDAGQTSGGESIRDITKFEALSMRAGQMYDAIKNTPGEATNFSVMLRDEDGAASNAVSAGAFGDLSYPDKSTVDLGLFMIADTAKSAMRTVRIPLSYFTGVDKTRIASVELRFDDPAATKGEILFDSLELVD